MLIVIAIANVAIASLCLVLTWRVARLGRQLTQLNRELQRWTVLLENALVQQTLALGEKRAELYQWQLTYLQGQLYQRRLAQAVKFLQLVGVIYKRRL